MIMESRIPMSEIPILGRTTKNIQDEECDQHLAQVTKAWFRRPNENNIHALKEWIHNWKCRHVVAK